jgi:hypothetical protein
MSCAQRVYEIRRGTATFGGSAAVSWLRCICKNTRINHPSVQYISPLDCRPSTRRFRWLRLGPSSIQPGSQTAIKLVAPVDRLRRPLISNVEQHELQRANLDAGSSAFSVLVGDWRSRLPGRYGRSISSSWTDCRQRSVIVGQPARRSSSLQPIPNAISRGTFVFRHLNPWTGCSAKEDYFK